jgi:hypothetical protein
MQHIRLILRLLYAVAVVVTVCAPLTVRPATPAFTAVSEQSEVQQAVEAMQLLLAAYTSGNEARVESLLEPKMIGYSRVVDGMRDAQNTQRQLRLTLSDTRTQISEHVVLIQTRWEKRFVTNPGRQAVQKSGTCTLVMRPDLSGWRLSALNGDNPFSAD